jgi:hypothetical protein
VIRIRVDRPLDCGDGYGASFSFIFFWRGFHYRPGSAARPPKNHGLIFEKPDGLGLPWPRRFCPFESLKKIRELVIRPRPVSAILSNPTLPVHPYNGRATMGDSNGRKEGAIWMQYPFAMMSGGERSHGDQPLKRLQLGVPFRRRPLSLWPRCRCPSGPASPAFRPAKTDG